MEWELQLQLFGKVVLAILLGGLIGIERESANKPAGIRTNMLIAASSVLMIGLGEILIARSNAPEFQEIIRTDPIRIFEAIIVGVSFIGGGTIIQSEKEERVKNLTTAAAILLTSGVGIAVALDQYILATALTGLVLFVNYALALAVVRMKRWFADNQTK